MPFYDPVRAAEDAALLDVISDDRLIFGVAIGYKPDEFDVHLGALANQYLGLSRLAAGEYERAADFLRQTITLLSGDRSAERVNQTGYPAVLARWLDADHGRASAGLPRVALLGRPARGSGAVSAARRASGRGTYSPKNFLKAIVAGLPTR